MLLKPHIKLDRITEITPDILKKHSIRALILDVDNTLSTHHGNKIVEGFEEWKKEMHDSGIKLMVLSNSLKHRIEPFSKRIKLPFISSGMKPLPIGYFRATKKLGEKRKHTAIVGDQIFTDVLGGNLTGVKTILLTPIKPEKQLRFRLKRKLEKLVFKIHNIKKTEI
ncbi:MAG: YqeG family HAD IIIA-type phosphatase [Clostridia bacterium]|nr:YqeG family HAD IIIA-type phosphatase [Clostridia bacterium]